MDKHRSAGNRTGVEELTPGRVLIAEMIRRYWVLGIDCTCLEVQKLGWFLVRSIDTLGIRGGLELDFKVDKYGPYSDKIWHLLNPLDDTYLNCSRRLSDASPTDTIWFDEKRRTVVDLYLHQESSTDLRRILDFTAARIDGFESPMGMELLSTVDWLIEREHRAATVGDIRRGLQEWPAGEAAAERKLRLFDDRLIGLALQQLAVNPLGAI